MKREIKFKGKVYPTLASLLRTNINPNLSHKHFCKRLNVYGWSVRKALLTKVKDPTKGREIIVNEKKYVSIAAASKKTGIKRATISHRINRGKWPRNKLLEKNPVVDNLKPIIVDGTKFRSSSEAAKSFGINNHTFLKRLRSGWTSEQAAGLKERPIKKSGTPPVSTKNYIKRLKEVHGKELDFKKAKFGKAQDKIEVVCNDKIKHDNFWATPNNLLKGRGCPICKISRGCKVIARWLEKKKINYITEWTDHDLYSPLNYKAKLRFDFYIKKLNLIIEYDGEQHFKPMTLGKMTYKEAKLNFKKIKTNDKLKNKWARRNRIKLLRIRYDQNILKELTKHSY